MNSILDIAEPMLGVDRSKGDRAYIRRQDDGWLFITKDPEDTIYYPLEHPFKDGRGMSGSTAQTVSGEDTFKRRMTGEDGTSDMAGELDLKLRYLPARSISADGWGCPGVIH